MSAKLLELAPGRLRERLASGAHLYLPFGTVEWHSDHLPLGLDTLVAERVCEALAETTGGIAGPPTSWGINGVPFPFTARIEAAVLEPLYLAVFQQMAQVGFRVQLALAGHYSLEQYLALKRQSLVFMQESDGVVIAAPLFEFATDLGYDGVDHAGHWETSLMLWANPALVDLDRLKEPRLLDGVIGRDPRGASASAGETLVRTAGERISGLAALVAKDAMARARYVDVLSAQVSVLELIAARRAAGPRSTVPTLMSEPYRRFLTELAGSRLEEAKRNVTEAWAELHARPRGEA